MLLKLISVNWGGIIKKTWAKANASEMISGNCGTIKRTRGWYILLVLQLKLDNFLSLCAMIKIKRYFPLIHSESRLHFRPEYNFFKPEQIVQ